VVRYTGNQLKIGVKDKEIYQKLNDQKVWPMEIQNNQITVIMPKFIPEQFSLVVRYISQDLSTEQVAKEVKRSASTAENFRAIVYPYARSTNDFRFTVSNQNEYNGLLRLGHIGIGNRMRIVTPYRPANKLTYCTKCWKLGHIRNKCLHTVQKCRICLLDYNEKHNDICSKNYQCAQCHQNHYSLDADCQLIQQYRGNLNRAVRQATVDGVIKVMTTEPSKIPNDGPYRFNNQSFPPTTALTTRQVPPQPAWKITTQLAPAQLPLTQDITNQQLFDKISNQLEERSKIVDSHIIKIEQEIETNGKDILDLRQNISNIMEVLKTMIVEVISPVLKSIPKMDGKTKESIDKIVLSAREQIELIHQEIQTNIKSKQEKAELDDHQQVDISKK
jgi:hypothetical protein